VEQLLRDIYHPARSEVESLHHHAGGLVAILSKPQTRENPWIIVFVVTGMTASMVATSQRLVEGTGRLTMGGTRLISPGDLLQMSFSLLYLL
jgi:hypothetical protein